MFRHRASGASLHSRLCKAWCYGISPRCALLAPMNFATTRILTRNPAEPWVVMSLRLNIQDFEEELQPNALLAAIQSMEKRKIWNMCMVCQQVLTAKRLEREKNAGKRVVIQSCVCPTPSVSADAFLTKYRVWRHLGRYKHRLRSHGGTNFAETNSPGGQHSWQTVRQSPQLHSTWRFQT